MNKTIGFIGAGNMGGAIIKGIIKKDIVCASNIIVYDKNTDAAKKISDEFGVVVAEDLHNVCKADVLFLAVKPNVIYSVIEQIKGFVNKDCIVVSIAAGQSIMKLQQTFDNDTIKIVRAMPNTPALVGEGMTAVSFNDIMKIDDDKNDAKDILMLFEGLGKVEVVNEQLMDAVTGISGSSPAYVFMFIEAMADAAVCGGMPREQAYTFAAQAVLGSAKMVLESNKHPAELKDMVCSPGGTTIEAVKVLEEEGFRNAVFKAVTACINKSKSM